MIITSFRSYSPLFRSFNNFIPVGIVAMELELLKLFVQGQGNRLDPGSGHLQNQQVLGAK